MSPDKNGHKKNVQSSDSSFHARSRQIVSDLFDPRPSIYWIDFSISVSIAYGASIVFMTSPVSQPITYVAYLVAVTFLYRASMFVHEVVHLKKESMRRFRVFWDIVAGIPMMLPTFAYRSHLHHHNNQQFGTAHDGEYLPLASGTLTGVALYLAQIVFQPILVFTRFLLLTPLSFLHPSIRRWVKKHASSLVINLRYERDDAALPMSRSDVLLEIACSLRAWLVFAFIAVGLCDWTRLLQIQLLAMGGLTLNHLRTLASHRYTGDGHSMSHLGQFLDSTIVTGNWLTEIICPLGLRYHALHHLFPALPYHNLGKAHQRLVTTHPPDSPYHKVIYPNLRSIIRELIGGIMDRSSSSFVNKPNDRLVHH